MSKSIAVVFLAIYTIGYGAIAFCHPTYTGYSGAPGTNGTCASSCHGGSGGTIQISGFPAEYIPCQTYTLSISHSGGSSIRQFNGSCRVGTGSTNAVRIAAGTNTATYNVAHETNGVHLTSENQNSGTFDWTAPAVGTGEVRLYIGGLQGNYSGQNSILAISAAEGHLQDVPDSALIPDLFQGLCNYPNPFNSTTVIEFFYDSDKPSNVHLGIYNLTGQLLYSRFIYCEEKRKYHSQWSGYDDHGMELPSGVYFYRLESIYGVNTSKMILMK